MPTSVLVLSVTKRFIFFSFLLVYTQSYTIEGLLSHKNDVTLIARLCRAGFQSVYILHYLIHHYCLKLKFRKLYYCTRVSPACFIIFRRYRWYREQASVRRTGAVTFPGPRNARSGHRTTVGLAVFIELLAPNDFFFC